MKRITTIISALMVLTAVNHTAGFNFSGLLNKFTQARTKIAQTLHKKITPKVQEGFLGFSGAITLAALHKNIFWNKPTKMEGTKKVSPHYTFMEKSDLTMSAIDETNDANGTLKSWTHYKDTNKECFGSFLAEQELHVNTTYVCKTLREKKFSRFLLNSMDTVPMIEEPNKFTHEALKTAFNELRCDYNEAYANYKNQEAQKQLTK